MEMILLAAQGSVLATVSNIVKLVVGLGFVIFIHELGHFLVAKFFGVKCEKFYIGFDAPIRIGPWELPRRFARWQWGETEYGIGIIPLGGYVKMLGQDDNPANAAREAERIRVRKDDAEGESEGEPAYELDPRSYPAKSVPARMAIISAGVIMNLISAVIFAGIAFSLGVNFMPCEIGSVTPGSPAWRAGLREGDKILQFGRDGKPTEYLWWDWDLRQEVAQSGLSGETRPIELKVRRASGDETWVKLTPSRYLIELELAKFVSIGITPMTSTTLEDPVAYPGSPAAKLADQLRPGDRVVAIDGRPIDRSHATESGDLPGWQLEQYLQRHFDRPVKLTLERAGGNAQTRTHEVSLPPQRWRDLGIICRAGPISAVRAGSPAHRAGIRPGDRLVSIDGEPIGDPMTLQQRMLKRAGETVTLVLHRGNKSEEKTVKLTLTDEVPVTSIVFPASRIAVDPIGIAFSIENVVADVAADSPAARAGIREGDRLLAWTFVVAEQDKKTLEPLFVLKALTIEQQLGKIPNWAYCLGTLQLLPASTKVRLVVQGPSKNSKKRTLVLESRTVADAYVPDRSLRWKPISRVHRAASIGDGFRLGWRFTRRKFTQVVQMVQKLVTGQFSVGHLAGPLGIVVIAGREASEGTTRLLLFLTFLSVNLAILNFLPIPALDGGHMVFLAVEGITGRPVNENVQGVLTMIGVLALLGLILFVTANDVRRFFEAWW